MRARNTTRITRRHPSHRRPAQWAGTAILSALLLAPVTLADGQRPSETSGQSGSSASSRSSPPSRSSGTSASSSRSSGSSSRSGGSSVSSGRSGGSSRSGGSRIRSNRSGAPSGSRSHRNSYQRPPTSIRSVSPSGGATAPRISTPQRPPTQSIGWSGSTEDFNRPQRLNRTTGDGSPHPSETSPSLGYVGPKGDSSGGGYHGGGGGHHGGYGGHHGHHRHHYGCGHYYYGYPYYDSYGYGFGYPYYGFYGGYGVPYASVYVGGGGGGGSDTSSGGGQGALDLDVKPKKAEVYINGDYVGIADQYDGFPTYLWLQEGTYDLVIFKEGFETLQRQITIYPGVVSDVKDRLVPGESVRPEDLFSAAPSSGAPVPYAESHSQPLIGYGTETGTVPRVGPGVPGPAPETIGRIHLLVQPGDAAVYLDGHFLGTAEELLHLTAGLMVQPGDHEIEVARPGYTPEKIQVSVPAGERATVELDLERP